MEPLKSRNILVTGGAGYIGSHTVVELLQKGFNVIVADNFSNSSADVLEKIKRITSLDFKFFQIDLTDQQATRKLFESDRIDAVIHFAAYKSVGESVEKPLDYYSNNLNSTINILDCCREFNTGIFVFSSSCSVYGEPDQVPVLETSPLKKPESPYANTKRICEEIIADFAKVSSINFSILRYFNPTGAHPSALIGEQPTDRPNNLVPVITKAAAGLIPALNVFGNDYPTPDGTCIRDYIHVVDVAKAHIAALERIQNGQNEARIEVYNLGTGKGTSVLEMIKSFEEVTGVKLPYKFAGRRKGDVIRVYADTSLANKKLNWKAEFPVSEMLLSAWEWQKNCLAYGK